MNEEAIFTEALARPTPAERVAYLDRACAGDEGLRRRVEGLIRSHEEGGSLLEVPAVEQAGAAGWRATGPTMPAGGTGGVATGPSAGAGEEDTLDFLAPPGAAGGVGRLGHYEVEGVVGRGGMGIVLRAFDTKLHRVVAIKVMAAPLAASATARRRFIREAQAAAAVCHEHVVTIHAVEEDHRPPYLVMQFVAGVSLQEKLDCEGISGLKEILRIGMQTAEGLAAAHRQGLVHRDIKPANILLENGVERVKITDFGLARAADDASLTQSGVIAGTPLYMSPEQAEGAAVDHRSDLFSLGSVLYAACTGRPPFRASTNFAVLKRVVEDAPRPIREINPEVPGWLCDLIDRLLEKDPARRPASAEEVAAILGRRLAELQRPGAASFVETRRWARKPDAPETLDLAAPRTPRAHPVLVLLLGTIALILAVPTLLLLAWVVRASFRPEEGAQAIVEMPPPIEGPVAPPAKVASSAEEWADEVSHLPPAEQVKAVADRLKALNPGFDGRVEAEFKDGTVFRLRFCSDAVRDIAPVRALRELKGIYATGSGTPHKGRLADLGPLRGMTELDTVDVMNNDVRSLEPLRGIRLQVVNLGFNPVVDLGPLSNAALFLLQIWNTQVEDLSPLAGQPLVEFGATVTMIRDLSPLKEAPLEKLHLGYTQVTDLSTVDLSRLRLLNIEGTKIRDLAPLKGTPLKVFQYPSVPIRDVSVLRGMPLESVECSFKPERDAAVLRSIATLKTINRTPAAEFWREFDARGETQGTR